jgi:hypothetical protein
MEQAFARRLAAERTKIEGQYSPYRQLIERTAAQYGITPEQYVETVTRQMNDQQRQQFQEKYNVTPEEFLGLMDQHPVVKQAREYLSQAEQRDAVQSDWGRFQSRFPEVTLEQIPREVWALMDAEADRGRPVPLLHAYLEVMHDQTISRAKNQGEQEAIRKLQRNASSTPGALGGGGADTGATSVGRMPQKDFDSLVESVLRGEKKQI